MDNASGHIHLHWMGMVGLALVSSSLTTESGSGLWPLFLPLSAPRALIPSLGVHLLCFLPHCGTCLYFSCFDHPGLFQEHSISSFPTPCLRGILGTFSASLVVRGTTNTAHVYMRNSKPEANERAMVGARRRIA